MTFSIFSDEYYAQEELSHICIIKTLIYVYNSKNFFLKRPAFRLSPTALI